jgi:hypothetical protein
MHVVHDRHTKTRQINDVAGYSIGSRHARNRIAVSHWDRSGNTGHVGSALR